MVNNRWDNDLLQFARFIEEAQAAGAFEDPVVLKVMADSMDLPSRELWKLMERAKVTWERSKMIAMHEEVDEPTSPTTVKCAVACHCADGGPDLVPCIVMCYRGEYDCGDHYPVARSFAEDQGYDVIHTDVVFDENDPGFGMLDVDWSAIQPREWVLSEALKSQYPHLSQIE